jgi:DNA polymerase
MTRKYVSAPTRARILHDIGLVAWTVRHPDVVGEPAQHAAAQTDDALPSWAELETAVACCTRCALAQRRQHTVFGVGTRDARWMVVGEAPGAQEDRRGEPFVGRAGTLLDAMLAALGTRRDAVFITNIVKCRPPGNRDPTSEEADACRGYLLAQIEHIDPGLILALGRVAAQQLLGVKTPVGKLRGRVHQGPGARPVVVTYHPAYLLRTPAAKRQAWADLQLAQSCVAVCAP